jgi:FBP C-terminal treble-clef zinc-finger
MQQFSQHQIRGSFVNCSKGEAKRLALPTNFDHLDWANLDFLGWVDPRATSNAYLVAPQEDQIVGISLRTAKPLKSRLKSVMCTFCLTTHAAADISFFSARRAGPAGRKGDTVGTYLCGDLACSLYLRGKRRLDIPQLSETITLDEKILRTCHNVRRFVVSVLSA